MPAQPIVFIVDEDVATGRAIAELCGPWGLAVRCFRSAEEFRRCAQTTCPGCIFIGAALPDMPGLELQWQLAEQGVSLPVIMMGECADVPLAVRAMRQGATTFLVKPLDVVELREQIHEALQLDATRRQQSDARAALGRKLSSLTPRERQVMHQLVSGRNTKQIADTLGISTTTVDKHRWKVLEKMEVECIVSLVNLLGAASAPFSPFAPPMSPMYAPVGSMSAPSKPIGAPTAVGPVSRANVPALEYPLPAPAMA